MSQHNYTFDFDRRWATPEQLLEFTGHLDAWLRRKGVPWDLAAQFTSTARAAALDPAGPPHRYKFSYVFTVARNNYITWMRRGATRSRHLESYFYYTKAQDLGELPAELELAERRERVMAAIDALPAHLRQLILAHYYESRSVRDIAADRNVSRQAVQKGMARARSLLEARLVGV